MFNKKILLLSLFGLTTAYAADSVDSYMFQPSSPFSNAHFYLSGSGAYSRATIGLQAAEGQPPLGSSKQTFTQTAVSLGGGYALDHTYSMPLRFALDATFRKQGNFSPFTVGYGLFNAKADIQTSTFLASTYYDFYTDTNFIPYVGLSAGLAHHVTHFQPFLVSNGSAAVPNVSAANNTLAWAATAGVWTNLFDNIDSDAFFRFSSLGKPSFYSITGNGGNTYKYVNSNNYYTFDIGLGFKYNFG